MRKFYAKDLPESPVYVAGHPLIFDFLETEDAALISELDKCIAYSRGGVTEITEDRFKEEVKKKENGNNSANSLRPRMQRTELQAVQWDALRAAGAEGSRGQFAKPQVFEREHRPHNRPGLPAATGPSPTANGRAMPDPIEVPTAESFGEIRPPTAKLKDIV
jgi:hypothetical protein